MSRIIIAGNRGRIGRCAQFLLPSALGFDSDDQRPELSAGDIVFSCCPYFHNLNIAKWALENNAHYCDLGGDPQTSTDIQNIFANSELSCITDLGLAPGWINIVTENLVKTSPKQIANVLMMVGGLPQDKNSAGPLQYSCTWSPEGLYNEYTGECDVLLDDMLQKVPALWDGKIQDDTFEAFTTKGGIGYSHTSLQKLGVSNCAYLTLRYKGHLGKIKTLLSILDREDFYRVVTKYCQEQPDIVIMRVLLDNQLAWEQRVLSDNGFSAMQIATASPACAVAQMLNNKKIRSYTDIEYDVFVTNLCPLRNRVLESSSVPRS